MLRQIIIPSVSNNAVILPETFFGKKVIVTVSTLDEKHLSSKNRLTKAQEARTFFNSIQVDLTGFKFNREEANER